MFYSQNEFGLAIAKLIFLEARKGNSAGGGANLISGGGNGWVRFWNTTHNKLIGEFVAHQQCEYRVREKSRGGSLGVYF